MIQNNLGNAYTRRIAGDLEANREQALACYETALQVFTLDAFPTEHWKTQLSRAFVEGQRGNWFSAHEAYVRALEAEAYHSAQRAFEDIVTEIRAAHDPMDFLRATLDPTTILLDERNATN
jgi:hypothetical protein